MKLVGLISSVALSLASAQVFASDLVLPDARHLAAFNKYACNSNEDEAQARPAALEALNVQFEKLVGDGMVIDFLITATFEQNGGQNAGTCRYSALLTRAKVRNNMVPTQTQAEASSEGVDCSEGKAILDATLAKMPYSYTTNPIRFIELKIPAADAAQICGEGQTSMKLVFERIRNK